MVGVENGADHDTFRAASITASRNSYSNTPRPCTYDDPRSHGDRPGSDSTGPSSVRSSFTRDCPGNDHVLACLLALNALRVSEACGADLCDLALVNGHRVVRIMGKGNQPALTPLAPRTSRAIDAAVGERTDGPLLARANGTRLDRHAAGRIVRRLAKRAGIDKHISPHSLRQPHLHRGHLPRRRHRRPLTSTLSSRLPRQTLDSADDVRRGLQAAAAHNDTGLRVQRLSATRTPQAREPPARFRSEVPCRCPASFSERRHRWHPRGRVRVWVPVSECPSRRSDPDRGSCRVSLAVM
jgi:hypothetical protein